MPCYLLHIVEQQDPRPYDDPDVKDVVGGLPVFFCTRQQPAAQILPGEAMRCIGCEAPCWKPAPPEEPR